MLVVHPFRRTILAQYEKRTQLFPGKDVLPELASLTVIQAVQGLGGQDTGYADWFDALTEMERRMDAADYDVAIVGAGAYSLPLAVSKVVSAKVALGEHKNAWRSFKAAMYMSLVVGAVASAITFFGAGFFTGTLLNTPESELCLKVLALAIFVMAVMGVLRGYFQGMGTMMPTAVSQVIEQLVNAVVSIVAASMLYSYGASLDQAKGITDGTGGAVYGAAGSTLGTSLGAAAGLIFLVNRHA